MINDPTGYVESLDSQSPTGASLIHSLYANLQWAFSIQYAWDQGYCYTVL